MAALVRLFLAVLIIVLSAAASAQPRESKQSLSSKQILTLQHLSLRAKQWTVDEGLPSDRIIAFAQTSDGHLWVSGQNDNIAQLRSEQFVPHTIDTSATATPQQWKQLAADKVGKLWMLSSDQKLMLHDGEHATAYPHELPQAIEQIDLIFTCETNPKSILAFASSSNGAGSVLFQLSPEKITQLAKFDSNVGIVQAAIEDDSGMLWFTNHEQQLFSYQDGQVHPFILSATPWFSPPFKTNTGAIAVCGRSAIYRLKPNGTELTEIRAFTNPYEERAAIGAAHMDPDGIVWLKRARQDIELVALNGKRQRLHITAPGYTQAQQKLFWDAQGTLWIATYNGLFQIAYSPFVSWRSDDDFQQHRYIDLSEDGEGTQWFTAHGAVASLKLGAHEIHLAEQFQARHVPRVHALPVGGAAVIQRNGIVHWYRNGERTQLCRDLYAANPQRRTRTVDSLATQQGNLWVATSHKLYYRSWSPKQRPFVIVPLPANNFTGLYRGQEDTVYVTSKTSGIFKVKADASDWQRLPLSIESAPQTVTALHQDDHQRLWFISANSSQLSVFQSDNTQTIQLNQIGLGNKRILGMTTDSQSGMWFSTAMHGVAYLSTNAIFDVINTPNSHTEPVWFDQASGLNTKAGSNSSRGITRSADGRIWVADGSMISVIDPEQWNLKRQQAHSLPVHIESFTYDGEQAPLHIHHNNQTASHSAHSQFELPPRTRDLEFEYSCIKHDFLGAPHYRYRLVGLDKDWVDAKQNTKAIFQNLPHGSYRFEVAVRQPDMSWSPLTGVLDFQVAPHWRERISVRFFLVIKTIAMVYLIFLFRMRTLKQRNRRQEKFAKELLDSQEDERKRIAAELHDSLGQDLLLIKNSTELARRKLDQDSAVQTRLEDISDLASHAIQEARNITTNLRPVELDRLGLRIAVQAMIDRILEVSECQIDAELTALESNWPEYDEINVFRIIQEALNNALKHSEANQITINTLCNGLVFVIEIIDNGKGFDIERSRARPSGSGLGIDSLYQRAQLLGGKLILSSAPNKGTQLRFEFPPPTNN